MIAALAAIAGTTPARAQTAPAPIVLDGEVPETELDHFFVPFEVPAGIVELELRHDDGSEANVLDWGLYDPAGWRGWGGGNAEPAVLGALAASRSYTPGPIAAGTWQVVVGKARISEPPGRYHVEIVLRTEGTLAPQPERRPYVDAPPLATGGRWYAGDLHVHSLDSGDASASLDEIALLAEERGLDFVVVTDHNTVSHLDRLGDAQDRHPDVLLIPGTEFTTYAGHAGAFGVRAWVDHKIGQPGVTIDAAAEAYAAQGALLSINHPVLDLGGACIGCAWTHAFPAGLAAIEIGTGGWEPAGQLFTPDAIALWESLCDEGRRLAAVGGSDDHRAGADTGPLASPIGSPTTMVWADALSAPAILAGIAAGRTVVKLQGPDDPMLELAWTRTGAVEATATGAAGQTLAWVVDGQSAERIEIDADPFRATLAVPSGAARVRAEIRIDGAPRTVASHLWTADLEASGDGDGASDARGGCGCGTAGAGAGAGVAGALVALAPLLTRGRTAARSRRGDCRPRRT